MTKSLLYQTHIESVDVKNLYFSAVAKHVTCQPNFILLSYLYTQLLGER